MSQTEYPHISAPEIRKYCEQNSTPHSQILEEIYERTLSTNKLKMASGPFLGRYLSMMSQIVAPQYILEVGTFTGYGTVCLLAGLQPNGRIVTIEKNNEMMNFSTDIFEKAGISEKIVQRHGDASDIINDLDYTFDLVFIDAAKRKYIEHYEMILPKLKTGGIILADNVLWKGKVATDDNDKLGQGLHEFNIYVKNDKRVENVIVPIDDGINFIRKL